jgi:hypothetical protein
MSNGDVLTPTGGVGNLGVDTISGGRGVDTCHSPKHAPGCNG